ncbi:MAG TPA: CADD family putative folate metabolism protein, partial [Bacteroidota bacterium]|nr:CADD family putative folate metabolism protein [Bacteroidota bacterium]
IPGRNTSMDTNKEFIGRLDVVIKENALLNHPFYRQWNMGTLSKEALREYAKQYNHFVKIFPTLVSATHSNTPHLAVRQELLENLIEEERGEGNHPGLWLKFAEALGISADEAEATPAYPETADAIRMMREKTNEGTYLEGVAALYAYESQIPEVSKVKIDGLKKYYSVNTEDGLSFFTVHEQADVYHSAGERNILADYAKTNEEQQACLEAAKVSSQAMLRLLDGVYNRHCKN